MDEKRLSGGLDEDQRAAVGLRRNGAVSAGAGSGKTTVLAARYLDLLETESADVRSILVLTFTRKAAAEMYGRIYRKLLSAPDPRVREQVDRFSEAQISTIDAFSSQILRPEAQDYGYPPDFLVDDAECRRIAEAQALSFLLERREEEALRETFARLGFETAWKGLFADAAARLWTPAGSPDVRAMAEAQRKALGDRMRGSLGTIRDAALLAAGELEASAKSSAKAAETAAVLAAVPGDLSAAEGFRGRIEAAAGAEPQGLRPVGFGKPDQGSRGAARDAARAFLDAAGAEALAPLTEAVLRLLADLGERVGAAKRAARVMSFRDAAESAVDLLLRRQDLRSYWKRRFRYIMIDEFQDDDRLQKDLLYLLAERQDRSAPSVLRSRTWSRKSSSLWGMRSRASIGSGAPTSPCSGGCRRISGAGPPLCGRTIVRSPPWWTFSTKPSGASWTGRNGTTKPGSSPS
jgi:ATP-dependent helicase/nuclease subunit A